MAQTGNLAEARVALQSSLAAARSRQDDYEIALSLSASAWLDRIEGGSTPKEVENEARSILGRLGVEHVSEIPLPVTVSRT